MGGISVLSVTAAGYTFVGRNPGEGRAQMFVWHKRSGEKARMRFYWWPLLLSIVLSIVLTILINAVL